MNQSEFKSIFGKVVGSTDGKTQSLFGGATLDDFNRANKKDLFGSTKGPENSEKSSPDSKPAASASLFGAGPGTLFAN